MDNHQQDVHQKLQKTFRCQQIISFLYGLQVTLLSMIFAVVWTIMPISEVSAATTPESDAHKDYRAAQGELCRENPEACRGAKHAGNLEHGEVVSLEGDDPSVSGSAIKDGAVWDIIVSILLFIIAAVASLFFVISCVDQPSAWVMVAGTIAFVTGEIFNWVNFDKNIKHMTKKIEALSKVTQQGKDLQIAIIDEAIALTESAAEHTKNRLICAGVATALWFAGAIVAIIEGIVAKTPGGAAKQDNCTGASTFNQDAIWNNLLSMVLPKAHAGGAQDTFKSIGLGVVALILVLVITQFQTVKSVLNSAKSNGFIRAAIFAVIGALGVVACVAIAEGLETLKKRIAKFQELKDKIVVGLKTPDGNLDTASNTATGSTEMTGDNDSSVLKPPLSGMCAQSNAGTSEDVEQVECERCAGDTCGNLNHSLDPTESLSGIQFPPAVLGSAQRTKEDLKNLSNGRGIGNGMREVGSGANIKRMVKTMKDVQAMADSLMKKRGLPAVPPMDTQMAGFMNTLMSDAYRAVKTLTPEQQLLLKKEFGYDDGGSGVSKDLAEKSGFEKLLEQKNIRMTSAGIEAVDFSGAGGGEDLAATTDQAALTGDNIKVGVDNAKYLEGLNVKNQDIVGDETVTIWRVLSNRYQRSAFKYFFTEDARK